ncbi:MAG: hypothetical protein M3Y56_03825 [Armatimonadota bacterium]|nr:hypothetical protein [Armatimonadota bacterium]
MFYERHPKMCKVQNITYDSGSQKFYASIPNSAPVNPNSVVSIDPYTGVVGPPLPVGREPGLLISSDDGKYLYVHIESSGSIQRIDIPSWTPGVLFPVGGVRNMRVWPGHSDTVIVVRGGGSGMGGGIGVYRDGVQLPGGGSPNHMAFSFGGMRLYTYENELSSGDFNTYAVGPTGLTTVDASSLFGGFNLGIFGDDNGRMYTTTGAVFDPETHLQLASIAGVQDDFIPEPGLGKIFSFNGNKIFANDYRTFAQLGTLEIAGVPGGTMLRRWGPDGFAYRNDHQVAIFRTKFVGPPVPPVDLSVTQIQSPAAAVMGKNLTLSIIATNRGSVPATGVVLTEKLRPELTFISSKSSKGVTSYPTSTVAVDLGTLPAGTTATLTAVFAPTREGKFTSSAIIRGDQPDSDPSNNISMNEIKVIPDPRPDLDVSLSGVDYAVEGGGTAPHLTLKTTVTVRNTGLGDAPGTVLRLSQTKQALPTETMTALKSFTVPPIPAGGSQVINVVLPVTAAAPLTGKFLAAVVDPANVLDEKDKKNNITFSGAIAAPPDLRPDLTGSWGGSLWTPRQPAVTDSLLLKSNLSVRNTGLGAAPASTASLFLTDGTTLTGQETPVKRIPIPALPAGSTETIHLNLPMTPGLTVGKYLIALLDSTNLVDEANKKNNAIVLGPVPALPDLTGTWGTISEHPSAGDAAGRSAIKGEFLLKNAGGSETSPCSVKFVLAKSTTPAKDDILLEGVISPPLRGGEMRRIDLDIDLPIAMGASGKYVIAILNADHSTADSDDTNNVITAGPMP